MRRRAAVRLGLVTVVAVAARVVSQFKYLQQEDLNENSGRRLRLQSGIDSKNVFFDRSCFIILTVNDD